MREEEGEGESAITEENKKLLNRALHQRTLAQLVPQFLMRNGWNHWGARGGERCDEGVRFRRA